MTSQTSWANIYTPQIPPNPHTNYELEKITRSLQNQLQKLKNEADLVLQEKQHAEMKLEQFKRELKQKEEEEEAHLEKLRKAMQNTQESFYPKKTEKKTEPSS